VIFPRLSRLAGDSQSFEQLAQRVLKYIVALGFLVSVVGYHFSHEIILLIYGHEYFNSIISFRILLIGTLPLFIWNITIVILNSIDREIIPFYGLLLGTLANVILNLFLIPVYGQVGASISTVICEYIVFVILMAVLGKHGIRILFLRQLIIPAASAILLYILFFSLQGTAPLVLIVLSPLIYVIFLTVFGFFDAKEYKLILELAGISKRLSSSDGKQ
jgi:O-antigen/teichoic acid export membrane protein